MTPLKRKINKITSAIKEVRYEINCRAISGEYQRAVILNCDLDPLHAGVIAQLKEVAIIRLMTDISPFEVERSVKKLDCPDKCKAWIISVLWFAFADGNEKKQESWNKVYNRWRTKFDFDYDDKDLRDKMLLEMGLTDYCIRKKITTKKKVEARRLRLKLSNRVIK